MKLLIAADVHGSAYYARKIVDIFFSDKFDGLILLGDIYNHGPRNPFPQDYAPMETAQILGEVKNLIVIQGNCDSEVDQMVSSFQFVRENVLLFGERKLFFTHGHVHNKFELPNLESGDVMFYGHTHVTETEEVNGVLCVNVGSAALPKDGKHVYCVFDEGKITVSGFGGEKVAETALPRK